ncbi:fibronectin type III domain-containing protein [Luteolibacter sp. GHJ8]|uniref:Fibronectin type III domain-containing protein n=1 Tax=Luteolibacter rhizosphaerae TaxID=2989719 RepID=A0ABT3G0Y2_9BACT|nr:fibronectin type III domain-containing protein [Luteolibacter rhizosphaerae]MCW1913489.1 fibronectin type III domain-containing protein [Luteolibacter rhizosphaerae]
MKNPGPLTALLAVLCGVLCFSGSASAQYEAVPQSRRWHPAEILTWSPATDPFAPYNRGTVPLANRFTPPTAAVNPALNALWNVNSHARPGEARVQAVTTFNTIPSGSPNGWRSTRLYAPSIWQYTDNMVFWGSSDRDNRTIMCPTAHMIDAAHRNGVRIYGKIFFHWNSSPDNAALQRIRDLIQKNGSTFPVADKLVEAAIYFGFDGWFINQENYQTNGTDAQNMRDFLVYFRTRAAAQGAPHLKITWYDAMAENGSRSFQNAFTSQNDGYMKSGTLVTDTGNTLAAHEMFLNFWWYYNSSNLTNSRSLAQTRGVNPYDLYAGIWTENYRTYGKTPDPNSAGNLDISWPYLFPEGQPHNTSVALFGAETPYVKGSSPETVANQDQIYWSGPNGDPSNTLPAEGSSTPNWFGMAHYIPANSPLTSLPFVTNFNVGQGRFYKINGTTVMSGPWTNLGVQDVLPTWRWLVQSTGAKTLVPSLDFAEAYYGGSSLKVTGSLAANLAQEVKLYQARLPVASNTNLRLIYKPSAITAAQVQIGYAFEDAPAVMHYTTAHTAASATAWNTVDFSLGSHAGRSLALITLRFNSSAALASYTANIGRIQISNGSAVAPAAPSAITLEGKSRNPDEAFSTSLRLRWTASSSPVLYYNIYHRKDQSVGAPRLWLGATPNRYFFAQDVRRFGSESGGYIEVEAVAPDHAVSPLAVTAQPTFTFESFPNLHHPLITGYPLASPLTVIGSGEVANMTRAFDDNIATFAEPGGASGAWVGLDLGAGHARQVVAVQFVPRANWASRMMNGVFQGSNTADFSSGVVELAKVNWIAPQDVPTTLLVNNATAFRYVRYLSPNDGYANVAEIKFFGPGAAQAPPKPLALQATNSGSTATLTWRPPASGMAYGYDLKRSSVNGGGYTVIASDLGTTSFQDTGLTNGATYYYAVSARNEAGESANSDRLILNPLSANRLNGTIIGTDGSWDGTSTKQKVFDNSLATFFDAQLPDGAWTGLDLGTPRKITAIRYSPRNGTTNWLDRMIGGVFQAADNPAFNNPVTLFKVPVAPTFNVYTSAAVGDEARYRYVRYLSPNGGHCNVSEIQFYGVLPPSPPGALALTGEGSSASLTWNQSSFAVSYRLKRSTTSGGPYQTIASDLTVRSFQDSGLDPQATYYYVVSAVNEAGEGVNSGELARHNPFNAWIVSSGGNPVLPHAGFDADLDGDGIANGVEYMTPEGVKIRESSGTRGVSALIRNDPGVITTLWESVDLSAWSQVSYANATDQSDVPAGFRRVESALPPASGNAPVFYRFRFSR